MFTLSRASVARFRSVVRRLAPARSKGPAPQVVVSGDRSKLTLQARHEGVVVSVKVPGEFLANGRRVVPLAKLDAAIAYDVDTVTITDDPATDPPFECPKLPKRFASQPSTLLTALHECGRSSTKEPIRYALNRIQLRGRAGTIVGTDSKQALVWGGFTFPFPEDVLIPAVSVFGTKELATTGTVEVGRTADHVVLVAGPWTVWLEVDAQGRFPDVASVTPRSSSSTPTLTVSEADSAMMLSRLPDLPGGDEDNRPVTLDFSNGVVIRAAGGGEPPVETPLAGSTAVNGPSAVALDRTHLLRALSLGFRTIRIVGVEKPVVFADSSRTFVVMPLDSTLVVPGCDEAACSKPVTALVPVTPSRRIAMRADQPDPVVERSDPPDDETPDPLTEAEALRSALLEAAHRINRLVQSLKARKKEQRALTQVWSSLKSLNLGPRGAR